MEELTLEQLANHDGYRLTQSWGEQFGGSWDYDVWRHGKHLRTFESEKAARQFIEDCLGGAYAWIGQVLN